MEFQGDTPQATPRKKVWWSQDVGVELHEANLQRQGQEETHTCKGEGTEELGGWKGRRWFPSKRNESQIEDGFEKRTTDNVKDLRGLSEIN